MDPESKSHDHNGTSGQRNENDITRGEGHRNSTQLSSQTSIVRSLVSLVDSIHSCENIQEPLANQDEAEKDVQKAKEKTEGKYQIVVLIAALCTSILLGMNWIAFPLFYVEFSEYFGQSKFVTGFIGSVQNALSQLLHLFISAPIQIYGCRPVGMVGGVILCLGYGLSCFAPSIPVLYLTYGVIGGML